jgi:hypothetical protein
MQYVVWLFRFGKDMRTIGLSFQLLQNEQYAKARKLKMHMVQYVPLHQTIKFTVCFWCRCGRIRFETKPSPFVAYIPSILFYLWPH